MEPFFFPQIQAVRPSRKPPKKQHDPSTSAAPCELCGLYASVKSPRLGVNGEGRLGILYLGEAQGINEDMEGRQFVGDAGQYLRQALTAIGVDFDRDLFTLNAVRCFTWKEGARGGRTSRTPTDNEIKWCHNGTWNIINALRPKAIIMAGGVALQSYLLDKLTASPSITQWRLWATPDQQLRAWVIPTYHPSFPMRSSNNTALANLFIRDLREAVQKALQPFFHNNAEQLIHCITPADAESILRTLLMEKTEFLELDFETTGLKPHKEGHDIRYMSISPNSNIAYSFPTPADNMRLRELMRQVLLDPEIPLGAHHVQFERLWAAVALGTTIPESKWAWDSQIAAHVLDDRSDITTLEFQVAARYGDWTFKIESDPYLKCPATIEEAGIRRKSGGNDINRIDQAPPTVIMKRNALDALYGRWLAYDQMAEMQSKNVAYMKRGKDLISAYWLFHDGTLALGDTNTDGGLIFDEPYFETIKTELKDEEKKLYAIIQETQPAKLWKSKTGKVLNPSSNDQLAKLLFGHYGVVPLATSEKTERGKVDYDLLASLTNNPLLSAFANGVLQYNKINKLRSTYIDGFARESVNNVIYPHLGLNIARSYRGNSSGPNFQNIPARDEWSRGQIRMGLFPHPGHRFVGADYGSHEFIVAANYSRDQEMVRYIKEGGDPHGDQARRLLLLTVEETTPQLRYIGKSGWVFPVQYGSVAAYRTKEKEWKGCAPAIWNMIQGQALPNGTPVIDHIRGKGIRNFDDFVGHCQAEEQIYWKKFHGLREWQQEWLARYDRDGVVPMYHGFRRRGLIGRNKVLNTSIQGTGFHFLLESLIEINKLRKQEQWVSKIIGQIHDEIRMSIHPDEFTYILQLTEWVMVHKMQQRHGAFLLVPLKCEFKATEIDRPWGTEKAVKQV